MRSTATHGVLFDVGYGLLDERPRLDVALRWLAGYLTERSVAVSADRLHELYAQACRAPMLPSLFVQTTLAAGAAPALAQQMRRELPWDATPMPPFPGALDALRTLRAAGLRLGVLANQPASARGELERCGAAELLDGIWLSEIVGLSKPDPAFFRLALDAWGLPASHVAYVGDRPDNDVAPAKALGLHTLRLLLGPHATQPARTPAERADFDAHSLAEATTHLLAWAGE